MSITAFTNATLVCPVGGEVKGQTLLGRGRHHHRHRGRSRGCDHHRLRRQDA